MTRNVENWTLDSRVGNNSADDSAITTVNKKRK